jgi:hypothetical protein
VASAKPIRAPNACDLYEPGAIRETVEFSESPSIDFVTGDCNMRDEKDVGNNVDRLRELRPESIPPGGNMPSSR